MANDENLIPLNKLSKKRQREIQEMGRAANRAKWDKVKEFRDIVKAVIGDTVKDKEGKDVPIAVAMTIAQVRKALKGDTRSFKAIADIVCDKQVDLKSSDGSMSPPLDVKIEFIKAKQEE